MKIGIAGVSGVGKSTLTKAVSEALKIPAIIDTDVHAAVFARMEQLGQIPHTKFFPNMTPEEHVNFERVYVSVRLEMESLLPDFIGDETPLDLINYFYHVCAPHPELMSPLEFGTTVISLWEQARKYDFIWYLAPGQIPIVDDHRRFTNEHLLTGWDFTLRGLLGQVLDQDKPMVGFLMEVPEFEKRVGVVSESAKLLKTIEAERKLMN
jgi:hypothetical protein